MTTDATKTRSVVATPDVHLFALHLAQRLGCKNVVDVGCAQPRELAKIHPKAGIVGLGIGADLAPARSKYPGRWVDWSPESNLLETVPPETALNSVVVSAIDADNPTTPCLIENLKRLLDYAPAALVTSRAGGSVERFRTLVESAGFCIDFIGRTAGDNVDFAKDTPLAILGNNHRPELRQAPPDYRVVAIVAAYNEEEIIGPSIEGIIEQGVDVYLLDNWSTDRTVERAERFLGRGLVSIEQFPKEGPVANFPYTSILRRKAKLAAELEADWFIHTDADEIRHSPWPGMTLKDALYNADIQGFNAVDHTTFVFRPIDNGYVEGSSFEAYFRHFDVATDVREMQIKAWRNTGTPVDLGYGHKVAFAGRRIHPYNFIYRHYPIQSQQHGERKIAARKTRMDPQEVAAGWHRHWVRFQPGHNFLRDPSELTSLDDTDIYEDLLVERLGNIGAGERAAWAARRPDRPAWRKVAGRVRRRLPRR